MAPTEPTSPPNKRKRGSDQGPSRPSPSLRAAPGPLEEQQPQQQPPAQNSPPYDDGLSQIIAHNNGGHAPLPPSGPNTSVAETAQAALTHYQVPASFEPNTQAPADPANPFGGLEHSQFGLDMGKDGHPSHAQQSSGHHSPGGLKPPVGSEEWHRIRRDNHKEGKRTSDTDKYTIANSSSGT